MHLSNNSILPVYLLVLAAVGVLVSDAYPPYLLVVPNGLFVRDQCGSIVVGLGHIDPLGGGLNNQFGLDFAAAGHAWTKELCEKDSDGDGRTNGDELGDPDCEWMLLGVPSRTESITNPGVNNNFPVICLF
ncbi:temptin-like [Aplysia californica]|uniref:Temptin-like n=1 Tax=Aplysia californica TaxID=6500 RepID=A0ABM0ZZ16_APLCA|nr:temptin-like [Aplysia californica]XP_012937463.1 temptin-like [Aplysia californica]